MPLSFIVTPSKLHKRSWRAYEEIGFVTKRKSSISTTPDQPVQASQSSAGDIEAFLATARELAPGAADERQSRGRLIFALDATMSRQPAWDEACHIQSEMFKEAGKLSGLDIKLIFFRGMGECKASRWYSDPKALARAMEGVACRGGRTQIRKVLSSALSEARKGKVSAVVYVGDCVEENVDELCARAGELGLLGVPMFVFQEGGDPVAEAAFREIARLSRGAYCPFGAGAARRLSELLRAVAAFASGGQNALAAMERSGSSGARLLLEQLK